MINKDDSENEKVESSASDETAASKDLKLIQKIIDKGSQMLDLESYAPRIQDVLKAIQLREKVKKAVDQEDSKSFWAMIEEDRQEELPKMYPEDNLESQLKAAIYSLRFEIKNGVVSVKAITDAYNLGKSKELQLTYQRIGHLLSIMGFQKVKIHNNMSGIIYDDSLLSPKKHLLGVISDDPYERLHSSEVVASDDPYEQIHSPETVASDDPVGRPISPSPLVGEGSRERGICVASDDPVVREPSHSEEEKTNISSLDIEKNEKPSPPSPPSPPQS
jgi:hypothetical protein